ncbi:MAG TPA: sugar ABC transporter ATP-binding protein [Conexibacter sp.]|nr:sugar ABC transporter ATP-binding protein [Conexibacter sp.]
MLALRDVTKRYGQAVVLDGVELELQAGEILALCGENGAGKSTLVSIVAGAIPHGAYEGELLLGGRPLALGGPADAERAGIAMLPQELLFYGDLTVAENVMAACLPTSHGMLDRRAMRARARELLAAVGLDVDLDTPVAALETSAQQLVCIARALALDPRVLILDEPTAALPRGAAERLFAVVRRLADEGRSVLYISHHLAELQGFADRVAVLRNGRLVLEPQPVPPVDAIVEAMLGETLAVEQAIRHVQPRADAEPVFRVAVRELRGRERTVLHDVALEVRPGQIVGLAGLTGSGREELMRLCVGVHAGSADYEVTLRDAVRSRWSPRAARRAGVFYLADDRRADGILALADIPTNVLLASEDHGARAGVRRLSHERRAVVAASARARLRAQDHGKLVGLLSGGNQQRVLFARAVLQDASVLLLSEPTRGIDVGARAAVHELIGELARDGRAIVVSSSDPAELATLCDPIVVLGKGSVRAVLRGERASESEITTAVTGGSADPAAQEEVGAPSTAALAAISARPPGGRST